MTTEVSKKPSDLKTRVTTGVIGGAGLVLWIVYGGRFGVAILAAVISLFMLWEYGKMVFALSDAGVKRVAALVVAWIMHFIFFWIPGMQLGFFVALFLGCFAYFLFSAEKHRDHLEAHFREASYFFFGLIYLGYLPIYFVSLRETVNGIHWTMLSLLIVWAGDTGGYFAGRAYGKRKLYELISPKKTVEGAIGGLTLGLVVTIVYKLTFFNALRWDGVVLIPLVVGSVAAIGDLCESFLKRSFATKDSGSILPGHGGFLDRFDGVVFSLPVAYACMKIWG